MSDLLSTGLAWLRGELKDHASQSVTIRRGSDATASVSAQYGKTVWRIVGEFGAQVRVETRDFLIAAADYVIDGAAVEPAEGDEIDVTVGSATVRYQVMSPDPRERAWRYTDSYHTRLRIHTKRVSAS